MIHRSRRRHLILFAALFPLLLTSCSGPTRPAPVVTVNPVQKVVRGTHTVREGETLTMIAFQYSLDTSELAEFNHIKYPYTLRVGQKLTLSEQPLASAKRPKNRQSIKKQAKAPKQVARQTKSSQVTKDITTSRNLSWSWPTSGQIITRFNENPGMNKGIDIANNRGTPIKAALPGKVVYSGEGLRGYGRLLILKHANDFLSAYAHNDELLVKEGQNVNQGQTIATMGDSDTNRVKLHFEIRYHGKPTDPLSYLPADQS